MADTTRKLDFRVDDELFQRIEQARGFEPRASFIKRAVLEAVLVPKRVPGEAPVEVNEMVSEAVAPSEPDEWAAHRKDPTKVPCPECHRFNGVHKSWCSAR